MNVNQLSDNPALVMNWCKQIKNASPVPELSFLPAPYRVWTRAGERKVQDNLHAHAQNAAIFPPKSGEKPNLEVFFRFGLWRDFLNDNIQATISAFRLIKTMSIFVITLSKITKEIFAKICWQLKTPTRTWKCKRCIMQMSYLYASDFPFKNFCKIAQQTETIGKNVWEKSNDAYSFSIRVQTTVNHISMFTFLCFFMTISTSTKMFSFRARAEKGIARHIDASSVVGTW